jgi:hypothetical protein
MEYKYIVLWLQGYALQSILQDIAMSSSAGTSLVSSKSKKHYYYTPDILHVETGGSFSSIWAFETTAFVTRYFNLFW